MTVVAEKMGIRGTVTIEVFGAPSLAEAPRTLELIGRRDALLHGRDRGALRAVQSELNDRLVSRDVVENLVTQVGDQYYGERAAGIGGAPAQVSGMRLGTGVTAASKTGAGAAIVTYIAGSAKAIDGSFPTSGLSGASRRITWKTSWLAGTVNGVAIAEVAITDETPLTDVTGSAANTISRALIGPYTLDVLATISVTWTHDLLGA